MTREELKGRIKDICYNGQTYENSEYGAGYEQGFSDAIDNVLRDIDGILDEYTKPKGKTLEQRKNSFIKDCSLQTMEYGTEMIMDFIGYWTEHSPTAKKMRFEKEKAFDISRRLKTWARNAQRFGGDRGTGINLEDW